MMLTIGAAAGDYYYVFSVGSSSADATVYGLTQTFGVGTRSFITATTYASAVSTSCTGAAASTPTCVALIAANGGGKAAIAFYVFSILFAFASAISMSISAHHLKTGKGSPGLIGSAAVSLTLESLAFTCLVIGCGCAWGTVGGLVNSLYQNSIVVVLAGPGAGLAGFCLFLRLLSLILEISARNCCKPGAASAPIGGGNTTIIIGGNPLAMASPMTAPQVLAGAPMGMPMAPPPMGTHIAGAGAGMAT